MADAPRFRSIARLLIVRIVALALLCMVLLGGVHATLEYREGQKRFDREVRLLAQNSLRLLSTSLWDVEPVAVQSQVDWLAHLPEVAHVRVRSVTGPVFEAGAQGHSNQPAFIVLQILAPEGDSVIGELEIWADTELFGVQALGETLHVLGGYAVFALLVCAVVAWVLRRELQEPLEHMARFAAELKPDTLSRPLVLVRRNPHRRDEIDLVARGFQRLQDDVRRHIQLLDTRVAERTQQLENLVEEVQRLSMIDALTGCFNRRALDERLPAEVERSRRYRRPLSVVFADVDHFKRVNDELGHAAGDAVLRDVAERYRSVLRLQVDWIARYGGEEFVIVLPERRLPEALELAERLRSATRSEPIHVQGSEFRVTASFGVAQLVPGESLEAFMARADALLYQAKVEGRDCVRGGGAGG